MKAMKKHELAAMAGVSTRTLRRWCIPHEQELTAMGWSPNLHVLPPHIVSWMADTFCIDL